MRPKVQIAHVELAPNGGDLVRLASVRVHDVLRHPEAGARYLRDLLLKYENDPHQVSKAVAAYNAGPGAVDKYNGIPPYRETVDYVNRVLKEYEKEQLKKKTGATD